MITRLLLLFIKLYQLTISPYVSGSCRFEPSCSNYAILALKKHGTLKGTALTLKRLVKCGPWHPGGIDEP